jgi:hypothetical protein
MKDMSNDYTHDEKDEPIAESRAIVQQAEAFSQTTHHAHSIQPTLMMPVDARRVLGSPTATAAWALSNLCNTTYSEPPQHGYTPHPWTPYAYPSFGPYHTMHQESPSFYPSYLPFEQVTPITQERRVSAENWQSIPPSTGPYRRPHMKVSRGRFCH